MNNWEKYNISVNDWDTLVSKKIQENFTPGDVFCDVGACLGIYTNFFKQISDNKSLIYSFEMNPYNYTNLISLCSEKCIVENLAISDIVGEIDVYSDDLRSGNHISNIIGHDTSFRKMNSVAKVKSTTLDTYFESKKVDILKIDVEGAELQVLLGGTETIKKCKFVIIECHFDEDWKNIYDILLANSLDFKYLVNDEQVFYKETNPSPGISNTGRGYQIYYSRK